MVRFRKFSEFSKLKNEQISEILEFGDLTKFQNFPIWKINKFIEFFSNQENQNLANFGIIRPFDIPHCSQFRQFSYLPFDITQFRRFNFAILLTSKPPRKPFTKIFVVGIKNYLWYVTVK